MPRAMSKAEREARDALVLQMFIAGWPYRRIGADSHINLSAVMVHKVVKREMAKGAARREFLGDTAYQVHTERLEAIYAANYATAVNQKANAAERIKAGELCRRLLDQLGKLHGLTDSALSSGAMPTRLLDDGGDDEVDEEDELSAYRNASRDG